jgi:hypothetical protein
MVDEDEAVLSETVRAHIGRLRQGVLARLESAGPLLPGPNPLAAVSTRPPSAGTAGESGEY